ncbi:DUF2946 family protein [uncultured Propionivibrio sp.]|uniref:DUF2946 family protein n=1 Tax=uncultured Propionivibrio sp. TaxID=426737 RepID=UPI0029C098E0|nr:DUF2946 family protein [uncultured Propionivibrio sp.]
MRRRSPSWFALVCAFFLLFAQGAAFAHWIEHVGADTQTSSSSSIQKDAGGETGGHHDKGDDHCLSCLAYAGILAAPSSDVALSTGPADCPAPCEDLPAAPLRSPPLRPYGARAPPIHL